MESLLKTRFDKLGQGPKILRLFGLTRPPLEKKKKKEAVGQRTKVHENRGAGTRADTQKTKMFPAQR